jgi:hypothetical protein
LVINDVIIGNRLLYKGIDGWQYKNGAIMAVESGQWLKPMDDMSVAIGNLKPARSSEEAKALLHARWHGKRQAEIVRVVAQHLADDTIQDIDTADALTVGVLLSEVVLNPKVRGIDRIKAWEVIAEHAGMSGRRDKADAPGSDLAQAAAIGAGSATGILLSLMQELEKRKSASGSDSGDVVDGSVT